MSDNPYAAPQVDPAPKTCSGQSELTSPYGGYRNVGKLRYLILSLLGVGILVTGLHIMTLLSLNEANSLINDDSAYEESVIHYAELSAQIAQIQAILLVVTMVIWCFWKNKSCKNAWLFQSATLASRLTRFLPSHQNITPGWAVGYYFIPIVNLWKPYQAMAFIRDQVSGKTPVGSLVGLWWTAWLITNGSSNYFYRNDNVVFYTTAEATAFNNGIITDGILGIVALLFAAAVIQRLTVGQERMASEYKLLPE